MVGAVQRRPDDAASRFDRRNGAWTVPGRLSYASPRTGWPGTTDLRHRTPEIIARPAVADGEVEPMARGRNSVRTQAMSAREAAASRAVSRAPSTTTVGLARRPGAVATVSGRRFESGRRTPPRAWRRRGTGSKRCIVDQQLTRQAAEVAERALDSVRPNRCARDLAGAKRPLEVLPRHALCRACAQSEGVPNDRCRGPVCYTSVRL